VKSLVKPIHSIGQCSNLLAEAANMLSTRFGFIFLSVVCTSQNFIDDKLTMAVEEIERLSAAERLTDTLHGIQRSIFRNLVKRSSNAACESSKYFIRGKVHQARARRRRTRS
jgi:hypothetical protein